MEQPPRFIQNDSSLLCRLKKYLYDTKQAPHAWYAKMDSFLLDTSFSRCHCDNNVYTKRVDGHLIILVFYVDDFVLTSSEPKLINHVKSSLKKKFDMTYLRCLHYFLVFKSCNLRKAFPFLNISMHVTFYVAFTWKIVNQALLPFSLESSCLSHVLPLKWMPLYIINLLVSYCILPIHILTFSLLLVLLLGICNARMKAIGKQPKEYFDTFTVKFSS